MCIICARISSYILFAVWVASHAVSGDVWQTCRVAWHAIDADVVGKQVRDADTANTLIIHILYILRDVLCGPEHHVEKRDVSRARESAIPISYVATRGWTSHWVRDRAWGHQSLWRSVSLAVLDSIIRIYLSKFIGFVINIFYIWLEGVSERLDECWDSVLGDNHGFRRGFEL